MKNQLMAILFWILGAAFLGIGLYRVLQQRKLNQVKPKKPNIYGITAREKMKADWNVGQAAGEQFGLMIRQKVIKFFKGGKDAR